MQTSKFQCDTTPLSWMTALAVAIRPSDFLRTRSFASSLALKPISKVIQKPIRKIFATEKARAGMVYRDHSARSLRVQPFESNERINAMRPATLPPTSRPQILSRSKFLAGPTPNQRGYFHLAPLLVVCVVVDVRSDELNSTLLVVLCWLWFTWATFGDFLVTALTEPPDQDGVATVNAIARTPNATAPIFKSELRISISLDFFRSAGEPENPARDRESALTPNSLQARNR
jgi:hypothetical protein